MKNLIGLIAFILFTFITNAQDSVRYRVIFIGDAGEIDKGQQAVISTAASKIIKGKTTVMYLGDNIYPVGMGLPGSKEEEKTKQILQSQYKPMRANGAPVYFIPGNHDWDRMGKQGLAKIKRQWSYLEEQKDPLLKMAPANGCPDPIEINLSDSLVIIAFDSEWWLFTHDKTNADADCRCNTKKEIAEKVEELAYKNRYKVILLASHHPFQSYGHHGGYYSLKDHLFPLTAVNKKLYIPLPIIGSIYPLLRSTFVNPEDAVHPLYKDMIKQIDGAFEGVPNLIHVAGHEHGLQFIKDKQIQIVSGAGAKEAFVKKGKNALFAETAAGFVTADLLVNNNMQFTYYTIKDTVTTISFTYTQPYTNVKEIEDAAFTSTIVYKDSIVTQANAKFDSVNSIHRFLFGENYRKEWSAKTNLPIIKISKIEGGLTPIQRGGGHQSKSLRLKDRTGKEWVLRTVNKNAEILLPEQLRTSVAKDIVIDATSAQHPYSALVVPVLANAANVPHANPIIGFVAPDKALGIYNKDFMNTVCLLEEREPAGKGDNSLKMYKELKKDNDNSVDSSLFLRARLLDLFIGDWDRHEDQWRWLVEKNGKDKKYKAVPRDRDQVFHVIDGIVPTAASRPWVAPFLHNFDGKIKQVNAFFTESNTLNKNFLNQFSYEEWMKITNDFVAAMTDSVLEKALHRLPVTSIQIGYDKLLNQLKERRENLPSAMEKYYRFLNKIVDIQTSDKNELVTINDATDKGLQIIIKKINKDGKVKDELFNRIFYPSVTKEIRLYISKGDDSISINNHSSIKLRIIGGKGDKIYNVIASSKNINLYDKEHETILLGNISKLKKHLPNDSANTAYLPTNPYNRIIPSIAVGYNVDDGIMLGLGVKFINQGFRKLPYSSMQQFSFRHSFSSEAFNFKFHSEWLKGFGKADLLLDAKALAPDNTQNFFGVGNNTSFIKTGNYNKYYRARFGLYQIDPALRWRSNKTTSISIGPSFQYYRFDADDNINKFINNTSLLHTYDSITVANDKTFAGIVVNFIKDDRNNKLLPTNGGYINVKLIGYTGLNKYSKSFAQIIPELAIYKSLDNQSSIVLANRTGGGISIGKTAFYQAIFLGGHENLLGYKQYRFAGQSMLYNNTELRIKLANIGSYILPGQLGIIGMFDVGKVWADGYNSNTWHTGAGGGIYFAPAQIAVLQVIAAKSNEGWYPYFTLGFRF